MANNDFVKRVYWIALLFHGVLLFFGFGIFMYASGNMLNIDDDTTAKTLRTVLDSNAITFLITMVFSLLATGVFLNHFTLDKFEKKIEEQNKLMETRFDKSKMLQEQVEAINRESLRQKETLNQLMKDLNKKSELVDNYLLQLTNMKIEVSDQVATINNIMNQYSLLYKVESLYTTALRLQPTLESQQHHITGEDSKMLQYLDKNTTNLIKSINDVVYYRISEDIKCELVATLHNTIYIFKMEKDAREKAHLDQSRILNILLNNLNSLLGHVKEIPEIRILFGKNV